MKLKGSGVKEKSSHLGFERIKIALVIFGLSVLFGCIAALLGVPLTQGYTLLHVLGVFVVVGLLYLGYKKQAKR